MLQFCGPDTVLKVTCTGAWRWNTSSPEVQRQVIAARRLCVIAASIRDSDCWSPQLWPLEFRGCRYIALVAVAHNGRALQYASEALRADKQVVLAALRQDAWALQFVASDFRCFERWWSLLRADKEAVLTAVENNGNAHGYALLQGRKIYTGLSCGRINE